MNSRVSVTIAAEQQREVRQREQVEPQRLPRSRVRCGRGATTTNGADRQAATTLERADEAAADRQLGHEVEQQRVEHDLLARLVLARATGIIGTPAFAYSSFISSDSDQKCGGVQ